MNLKAPSPGSAHPGMAYMLVVSSGLQFGQQPQLPPGHCGLMHCSGLKTSTISFGSCGRVAGARDREARWQNTGIRGKRS